MACVLPDTIAVALTIRGMVLRCRRRGVWPAAAGLSPLQTRVNRCEWLETTQGNSMTERDKLTDFDVLGSMAEIA